MTPGRALQGVRRLLESRQVDLLAGALSSAAVVEIKASLEEARTPLIVTNFGANTVRPEEESPFVFHNTLNHWRRSFTAGAWATREFGARALVVASLLDSGFDHLYAVEAGVKAAGGEVAAILVTDRMPGEHDLVGVLAALEETRPNFIYLLHSDPVAALLVRRLAERSAGRVPLVAADMMMSDSLLAMQGAAAQGVAGVAAWSIGLPLAENHSFVARYRRWTRQEPDSFAMLGYETAQLLEQALTVAGGARGGTLLAALGRAEVTGPRGRVQMQPLTRRTVAPNYLQQVQLVGGSLEPVVLREMDTAPGVAGVLSSLHAAPRSGWLHDYPFP